MDVRGARTALMTHLKQSAAAFELPGAAIGIVQGGQLVFSGSVGVTDTQSRAPVTTDTVFRIGSITKVFTGLAILALRDAGKLSLDDPVARFIPEISRVIYPTADSPRITIRHLVTHTSGLPRVGKMDYTPEDANVTDAYVLEGLRDLELESSPGTKTSYSNLALAVAGILVSRVSHMAYRDFVGKMILEPLGMSSTAWERSAVSADRLATGYRRREGALISEHHWNLGAAEALGGLYSTVNDMARFLAFQLDAWPARSDPDTGPIRRSSVRESQLLAGFSDPGGQGFGVNWGPVHHPTLGLSAAHAGGTYQYGAVAWVVPRRGLAVILLANCGGEMGELVFKLPAVAVKALLILLEHNPDAAPELSPTLLAAVQLVQKLVDEPTQATLEELAAPMLQHVTPERVLADIPKYQEALGRCAGGEHEIVRMLDGKGAIVRLTCEKGQADVTLILQDPSKLPLAAIGIQLVE